MDRGGSAGVPPEPRRDEHRTISNQPSRKPGLLYVILLLLVLSIALPTCVPAMPPGETQPAGSLSANAADPPRVARVAPGTLLRNVTILRGKTSVEVHIEASNPVKPTVKLLSQPERIVIDLAGVSCGGGHHLSVNAGDVHGVRVALYRADPPVTRVVVDLAHRHDYRLLPAGSTVILAIDFSPKPAIPVQPAAEKVGDAAASNAVSPESSADVSPGGDQIHPAGGAKLQPPALLEALAPSPAEPTPESEARTTQGEEASSAHQAAKDGKPGVVRSVSVSRERDAIAVRIEGSKPLEAAAATLSNPERIIIDLADVRLKRPWHMAVNAAGVQEVSAALFLVNPLVTRVVVNLARPHAYHLQPSGNSLTVRVESDEIKAAGSQPAQ